MNKKLYLIFLGALILLGLLLSNSAKAAGLVPCGGEGEPSCQLCHFFYLFENIIDFVLIQLVPPVAVLMLVIGGLLFIFSYGVIPGREETPTQINKAKKLITSVLIGLLIIYGSWLIINTFLVTIGVEEWTGLDEWFELDIACPGVEEIVEEEDPFGVSKEKLNQAIDQAALETIDINQTFSD